MLVTARSLAHNNMAVDFSAEEAITLKRWREIDAFQRQLALSQGNPSYTFFDGELPASADSTTF